MVNQIAVIHAQLVEIVAWKIVNTDLVLDCLIADIICCPVDGFHL